MLLNADVAIFLLSSVSSCFSTFYQSLLQFQIYKFLLVYLFSFLIIACGYAMNVVEVFY